jgi:hypothetical protein
MKVGEIKMFATPVVFKATGRPSEKLTRAAGHPIIQLVLWGVKFIRTEEEAMETIADLEKKAYELLETGMN